MREFVRFAAISLSALLTAQSLFAADLRSISEPKKIASVFPAAAKLRLVNLWATWCVPCVAEMPDLRAIDAAFGPEVALAGVSMDNLLPDSDVKKVTSFLDKQKIAFPNVYYTGAPDALANHYRFSGEIPVTLIYDRNGRELWRHEGRLDRNKTIAQLRELLRRIR
jgi:thiol-disulfide isomerase/thioredoxin